MAISFFQALNPASKNSGVLYPDYVVDDELKGQELIDKTVLENISRLKGTNINLRDIFEILVGTHYSFGYHGVFSKGVLDYLIFPLVSRKILHALDKNTNIFVAILSYSVALPLETARFSLGIVLTLLIAPVALLINLFKENKAQDELNSAHVAAPLQK